MLSNYQELEFDYLFNLIEKHFKLVPSAAYMDIPDISLFDHSKTVCAISLSLFHQPNVDLNFLNNALDIFFKIFKTEEDFKKKLGISHLSKEIKEKEVYSQLTDNENNIMREEIFSLIHGDLSGIQDFIYSISTKHAMKTLKGRSLFISLLMDLIADWTVEELELSKANILFSGGGHFYILSHADIKEKVVGIRIKLNELMLKYFDTKLYFALDFIPLSCKELRDEISDKWKNVGEKTSKWKSKKFYELLEKEKSYKEVIFPEEREFVEVKET